MRCVKERVGNGGGVTAGGNGGRDGILSAFPPSPHSAMAVAERSGAGEGEEEASAELETSEPEVAEEKPEAEEKQRKKVPVPGVVYLSHVPPGFGPRQLRTLLGGHGELGRVFLQPRGEGGTGGGRGGGGGVGGGLWGGGWGA